MNRFRFVMAIGSRYSLWNSNGKKVLFIVMAKSYTGWWFGTFFCFHVLGTSPSQLTNSYFSEG